MSAHTRAAALTFGRQAMLHARRDGVLSTVVGLDVSDSAIGIAVTDVEMRVAIPCGTWWRQGKNTDMERLAAGMVKAGGEGGVTGFVLGWPLMLDGTVGAQCGKIHLFGRRLHAITSLPVVYWDERYSTQIARDDLRPSPGSRTRKKHPTAVDSSAATIMLLDFLTAVENEIGDDDGDV